MSSNNYNHYSYTGHQQSAAQNYTTYQTAPATNLIPQPSRQQYQQQPPAMPATTQLEYINKPYNHQMNGYGGQNHSWMGDSYGASREATSGAAEVLRNMSNTAYTPNPSAMGGQAGFTATDAAATAYNSRYSNNSPAQQVSIPTVLRLPLRLGGCLLQRLLQLTLRKEIKMFTVRSSSSSSKYVLLALRNEHIAMQ